MSFYCQGHENKLSEIFTLLSGHYIKEICSQPKQSVQKHTNFHNLHKALVKNEVTIRKSIVILCLSKYRRVKP